MNFLINHRDIDFLHNNKEYKCALNEVLAH